MIDSKGVYVFLGLTFGVTLIVGKILDQTGIITPELSPMRYSLLLLGFVLIPAFAAFLAGAICRDKAHPKLTLWPIPKAPALACIFGAPLLFLVIHAASALLGWSRPDWDLHLLGAHVPGTEGAAAFASTPFMLALGTVLTLVLGPTLYAVVCLGNELGWRGYLFAKLLPLGRLKAHLITNLLWGAWMGLFVYFGFFGDDGRISLALRAVVMGFFVGILLGEVWRRTRHLGLTAVCAGCLAAQAQGILYYLFPSVTVGWGGPLGAAGLTIFALLALCVWFWPRPQAQAPDGDLARA